MHFLLYVCLPRSEARTSLAARKQVCSYLEEEGFTNPGRFGGHADYFSVGGRWSGQLTLLKLQYLQPTQFKKFRKQYDKIETRREAVSLFKCWFPSFEGSTPVGRQVHAFLGRPDDAQVMDEPLFRLLKNGFSDTVTYAIPGEKSNVIFTDDPDDDFKWPSSKESAEFWVVVIDYHD